MSSKTDKDKAKQLQDKCQSVLNGLLRDEDNKYCVDCDSKGPRWASWNIGVFLCIRCAGIHRNLGVHISKVKSVNLDSWTPEQVVSLQQMGNSRARAVYEANLPDNFRRPQSDSSLESFIRAKYEHKKYIAREWVPPALPKVNWEKEIDEEIEKQKRKKKTVLEKKAVANVEVPQIPKPKNPSPKPNRTNSNTPEAKKKDSDLLGLQNGEDSFSSFLSASTGSAEKAQEKEKDVAKSEEESFFNQTAPTEKEKVKLTKDNILALYGSAPTNNFNQFPQQYPTNFTPAPPSNFQAFGGFPQQTFVPPAAPATNQFANWPSNQPQQQQQWGKFPAQTQMAFSGQFPAVQGQFTAQFPAQVPATNNFAQFNATMPAAAPVANAGFQQNPFFGTNQGNTMQQQFASLNLNSTNNEIGRAHV